jgi:hypothetical protein
MFAVDFQIGLPNASLPHDDTDGFKLPIMLRILIDILSKQSAKIDREIMQFFSICFYGFPSPSYIYVCVYTTSWREWKEKLLMENGTK